MKGKGVIEPDYRERGAHDYRKDACLTMNDFEKVILHCIVYYNSKRIIENFPFTEKMIKAEIKPYSSDIWNYCLSGRANLINTDYTTLVKTLLPRTTGKFTRKGLIVNRLRYKNADYTEKYLSGGEVSVAYNPEDVTHIWLIDNGRYVEFELIESRSSNKSLYETEAINQAQKLAVNSCRAENIQAKIDLIEHIEAIGNSANHSSNIDIKSIRDTRERAEENTH